MARKIKFALDMAKGVKVRGNLEEFRENFDLEKVVGHFLSGKLTEWLEDRYYENEAEAIAAIDKDAPDLRQRLCEALGVEYEGDEELDVETLERLNEKKAILRQKTSDEAIINNAAQTALTQVDLANLIDMDEPLIYLCGENFSVPFRVGNKKYVGILGTPKISIKANSQADLDAKGIVFENVMLPWGNKINQDDIATSENISFNKEINHIGNMIFTPSIPLEQLKEIFAGIFEEFQENYGDDTWDVVHLKEEEHCYEDFNATKKTIALNLVCQGKYKEEDLVFIRVTTDFKAGWAFTKDSFCCGGSIGSGIIPYSEIVSVRQYLGSTDGNGIWITTKQPNENIKFRKMPKSRGVFGASSNEIEYRVWSESSGIGSGYEVLTGYKDGDDMERIVAFLEVVKALFNQG